jgi:LuxR family transcriptional regulator, quorum-sensing system regulator BjaR1
MVGEFQVDQKASKRNGAANLEAAESGEEIRKELEELTSFYRFKYFALATVPNDGGRLFTDDVLFSSWPAELIHEFDKLNLAGGIIDYVMHSTIPLQLDLDEFTKVVPPEIADDTRALLGSYGVSRSVIFPVHNKDGSKAKVTFEGNRDFVDEHDLATLHLRSINLFSRYLDMVNRKPEEKHIRFLTVRERECLKWIADGKTSVEVGEIMTLSEHTVTHYLTNAVIKLNAANRVNAVAIAMRLNLLD